MKYLHEILERVLAGDSASTILSGLSPAVKGHTGEGLLRLLTLLGIHPTDPSSYVIPYVTIPTTRRLESLADPTMRLHILESGLTNSGGSNKIDVCWRDKDKIIVCSSKIGKKEIHSIADLEIPIMLSEFSESGGYTEQGRPVPRSSVIAYAFVDSAVAVYTLAETSKASNKVTKDNLNLLDMNHLNSMCAVLRERLRNCRSNQLYARITYLVSDPKSILRTRFHQKLICQKVDHALRAGAKTLLIGALPRSGKTYIGASIASNFKQILLITTRPGETRSQWNDVFHRHREFSSYFISDLNSKTAMDISIRNKHHESLVAIASIQFMKGEEESESRKCLIGLHWDLILMDEIHEGGSTERSDKMFESYFTPYSIRILMTATYVKPVEHHTIPLEHCFFWDLEDVRLMRRWGDTEVLVRLSEKYTKSFVEEAKRLTYESGETDASIRACYESAPRLGILTTIMQQTLYNELKIATENTVYGFSMRALFMPTKDGSAFQNPSAVDTFLELISGSNKMKHYKKGDMSMMARIRRYWKQIHHRNGNEFMTQIWFLPSGVGQLLADVKKLLIARIVANPILKNYRIMTLDAGLESISKLVSDAVIDAKGSGDHGLILLTGDVGSVGVSLPDVDVAFMLHDRESADKTYQQMMRVLTEMPEKKYGIVVDFNVWRVLTTLNTYATNRCGQSEISSTERTHWCMSHLIDVDPDLWGCPESPELIPKESIAEALGYEWRNMLEHTGCSLQSLARKSLDLGEDQSHLDTIASSHSFSGKATLTINEKQSPLSSGVEERRSPEGSVASGEHVEDVKKKMHANLNDLLARLIPEIALLSKGTHDLLYAIEQIHSNPNQRAGLNEFLIQLYDEN